MLRVLGFLGYCGQLGRWGVQKLAFATVDPQAHFKPLGWPALWTYALQVGPSAGPGELRCVWRSVWSTLPTMLCGPGLPANSWGLGRGGAASVSPLTPRQRGRCGNKS